MGAEPEFVAIAAVDDGARACIAGTVRQATELLTAPISKRRCVAYEVHSGKVGGEGHSVDRDVRDFVIDDGASRALVVTKRCELELGTADQAAVISVLDADLKQVEARLSDLKVEIRNHPGRQQQLAPEIRRAKDVATLLCAVRAHVNGNVHVGGSLPAQERYIRKKSAAYEGGVQRVPARFLDQCDVALTPGEKVVVEGIGHWEIDTDPAARAAGYRSRPKRLVLRAPPDGAVQIRVPGGAQPRALNTEALLSMDAATDETTREHRRRWLAWLIIIAVIAVVWFLLAR